ncbi:hypothetical protein OAZ94_00725 [Prochlorococcus sp. AH-736-E05]|nr:hypothetical protein [Prochlorococcus sp. AH-736-E05]
MVICCLHSQDKPFKNPDIARNASACNVVGSVLGALGRRFESCRPDSHISRSQIYQNRVSKVSVAFPWNMLDL